MKTDTVISLRADDNKKRKRMEVRSDRQPMASGNERGSVWKCVQVASLWLVTIYKGYFVGKMGESGK